ncbi:branched-chain amino acid ABC transporter permease (plasmid) [Neorhizobium sp. SOG26]|jgi:ABC-type branched-chain amino acid transport system, permease component|uniref:Branched-chain amino acid ABC transporter permease n=1 Tax=Neorhizobium turbinariae TaxID=2937795 RepID=A0ABT0IMZ9_9HYPH|nr:MULTISPECIES: branched-chain amino acid ABC transporter permease [Neorhizobium]AXV17919.1 branched-chain amino acid ABC transporter permease [Neorhizobium sp. SOG26]MCK8779250.1 branched-chain amino acid ABC transporter permease [Neorhizobium turbinariae]
MSGYIAYLVFFLIVALTYSIVVMGLNLQWGFTGLFNAGVVGFFAIGAYGTAVLTGPDRAELIGGFGLPFPVGVIGGMILSTLAALVVGLATLRLREEYLAISTFGIAISIQLVALNFDTLTGGAQGLTGIPRPLFATFGSPGAYNLFYLGLVATVAAVVYFGLQAALHSPWGRLLKAIREDETAAASLGKNPAMVRLQAFVLGSTLMGLAGGLYVGFIGYVSPMDFLPILTFQIWAMLIVGGSGNNRGAIVGAVGVWALWTMSGFAISRLLPVEYQSQGGAIQVIIIGLLIVLTLLFRPRGLIGEAQSVSRHVS